MSAYTRSESGSTLYSQVARAMSMFSGTFSSVKAASGMGTCWTEANYEGQPPLSPRAVKRCARLESEIVQLRKRLSAEMPFLPIVQSTDGGGLTCEFMFPTSKSSSKSRSSSSESIALATDSIEGLKEIDVTDAIKGFFCSGPQENIALERLRVVDPEGVQERISGPKLETGEIAVVASPSEDVTSADQLLHIADKVLTPLLPDELFDYASTRAVKQDAFSEIVAEDETLAVTIAPIVVTSNVLSAGEYAVETGHQEEYMAETVNGHRIDGDLNIQKAISLPHGRSHEYDLRDQFEIISPELRQRAATDELPSSLGAMVRRTGKCDPPLTIAVEHDNIGLCVAQSATIRQSTWSWGGTDLGSSVVLSPSPGLPGFGRDYPRLLVADHVSPTVYTTGTSLSSSGSWCLDGLRLTFTSGVCAIDTQSDLSVPPLLLSAVGMFQAAPPVCTTSGIVSTAQDSLSRDNSLDDLVMNSTYSSRVSFPGYVPVLSRPSPSQISVTTQHRLHCREGEADSDHLVRKTEKNLISLLLGVFLCFLLSPTALCVLLVVICMLSNLAPTSSAAVTASTTGGHPGRHNDTTGSDVFPPH